MLENSLAEIAGEKQRVGLVRHQRLQHSQLRDGKVLRLVGDGVSERLVGPRHDMLRHPAQDICPGHDLPRVQVGASTLEHGPKRLALLAPDPSPAAEARDVAIGLPALELPGVHHGLPLCRAGSVG